MGYDPIMDARRANPAPEPDPTGDWVEESLTAADIAACEEAEAEIARGEWVEGDVMMARLDAMVRKYRAKAAKLR